MNKDLELTTQVESQIGRDIIQADETTVQGLSEPGV